MISGGNQNRDTKLKPRIHPRVIVYIELRHDVGVQFEPIIARERIFAAIGRQENTCFACDPPAKSEL